MTAVNTEIVASKSTTQHAPLERLLTILRTRKILPYVQKGATVLDFGCGRHLRTLSAISQVAGFRLGIDSCFRAEPAGTNHDGVMTFGNMGGLEEFLAQRMMQIDLITALACFEHFDMPDLRILLKTLCQVSSRSCKIVGTVPTPKAKPVLEFLSYKLGLIDPSQIKDHRVYYDESLLVNAILDTTWRLTEYRTFQLGMNSLFVLCR